MFALRVYIIDRYSQWVMETVAVYTIVQYYASIVYP